jgi:hypothetical protein
MRSIDAGTRLWRIRLDPEKRKGGIKARRLIAAARDFYRAQCLGLT